MIHPSQTGIIILAAGASQRLGTPKQLLLINGETLLQRIVHTVLQTGHEVVVVLGAYAAAVHDSIRHEKVHVVVNEQWPQGMASSIQKGLKELLRVAPAVSRAFLLLCDQPYITTDLLSTMSARLTPVVACAYNNTLGTPALFNASLFPELMSLSGQEGAKKILLQHTPPDGIVPFPEGSVDIDTHNDYARLL
ncbi:nucleotidyltransferase family protein [Chitinophaga vietnamensis]|uniref:nucleotidyltransferase family protein n=1 Tax=Chitinophaga vietnamensis TaxID=2593957 RepID=UPI00117865C2|nr:nucleotidyltransferase family protein [Chitinophaga vietnamensis]